MLLIAAEEKNKPDAIEATYVIEMSEWVSDGNNKMPNFTQFDPMSLVIYLRASS